MSFGESFTKIRQEKGISRKDFAEQLGIPYTTLRNYEKDQREPGHKLLIKMATLLSVSVDELIGHEVKTKPAQLTPNEHDHIKKYRALDLRGKDAVDSVLQSEYTRCLTEQNLSDYKNRLLQMSGALERIARQARASDEKTLDDIGKEIQAIVYTFIEDTGGQFDLSKGLEAFGVPAGMPISSSQSPPRKAQDTAPAPDGREPPLGGESY